MYAYVISLRSRSRREYVSLTMKVPELCLPSSRSYRFGRSFRSESEVEEARDDSRLVNSEIAIVIGAGGREQERVKKKTVREPDIL